MNSELKNNVILITGASGGIGSDIVRQFAAVGYRLPLLCSFQSGWLETEMCPSFMGADQILKISH